VGSWTADDGEAARRMANELYYRHGPFGPTRRERFAVEEPIEREMRA